MQQPTNAQMAATTLELLKTAQIPMGQIQVGVAVHNWLQSFMQPEEVQQELPLDEQRA